MKNISISTATASNNLSVLSTEDVPSKAEGIAFCSAFALEAVLTVVGNLLTIVLFAMNRKLRKRSLFLVINMSFCDLMLGAVAMPSYIYFTGVRWRLWAGKLGEVSEFIQFVVDTTFTQVSLITAVFISLERFDAIYRPLKHRTLSVRAYRIVIFLAWTMGLLVSSVIGISTILSWTKHAILFWASYVFTLLFIVCGCNIAIWRKFRYGSMASQQQNRASQNKRLTKTLLLVSAMSLLSWIPMIIVNILRLIWGYYRRYFYVSSVLNYSSSLLDPAVYALRIPEFREALGLCWLKRPAVINMDDTERGDNRAAGLTPLTQLSASTAAPSHLNMAHEKDRQDVMDTKL